MKGGKNQQRGQLRGKKRTNQEEKSGVEDECDVDNKEIN
jgi:hypothetical protein